MTRINRRLIYPQDFLEDKKNSSIYTLNPNDVSKRYCIRLKTHFLIQELDSERDEPVKSCIGNLSGSLKNAGGNDFIGILNNGGLGNKIIEKISTTLSCSLRQCEEAIGNYNPEKIPVMWGTIRGNRGIIDLCRKYNRQWMYIDHAYLNRGHEQKNYRFGINKLFAYPKDASCATFDNSRLKKMNVDLKDWQKNGNHIVVCPPSETIMTFYECHNWLEKTLTILKANTERPLVVRTKPKYGDVSRPLRMDLVNAHALVTHCSNAAVEAVIEGIPVFVSDHSVCKYVGSTDLTKIENPIYKDRTQWLNYLSFAQFSLNELKDEECFKDIISPFCDDIQIKSHII